MHRSSEHTERVTDISRCGFVRQPSVCSVCQETSERLQLGSCRQPETGTDVMLCTQAVLGAIMVNPPIEALIQTGDCNDATDSCHVTTILFCLTTVSGHHAV